MSELPETEIELVSGIASGQMRRGIAFAASWFGTEFILIAADKDSLEEMFEELLPEKTLDFDACVEVVVAHSDNFKPSRKSR